MNKLRVVLDTNVLVSAIAYPANVPGRILAAWRDGGFELVISHYILDEMVRVLPTLKRILMTLSEIRDLADDLIFKAELVEPAGDFEPELRDPNDQLVLGTFRAAQADYLITGDKDLLALKDKWPIVTPAEFWARHGE